MNFSHLRDVSGQLIATIAWHNIDAVTAAYGAVYVSCSEVVSYVSPKIGRTKAQARCEAAINEEESNWFCYDTSKKESTWDEANFQFLSDRLDKLGQMPIDELKECILELREYYTDNRRDTYHNEYSGNQRIHANGEIAE